MSNDITAEDFKIALETKQLSLNFQPIINMQEKSIAGFEALMRWTHPEHGFISPGIFIPIAEKSGLIIEASEWCLEEACLTLRRIESRIGKDKSLTMSVNFTSNDFSEDEFLGMLYNIISKTDIDPSQIQLEITEQLLREQPTKTKQTLNLCRTAGLKIALDNFGDSGALDNLTDFPIDCLKIDRKYTSKLLEDTHVYAFIEKVIEYGKTHNIDVVTEGVETKEEVSQLIKSGAQYGQGYHFIKPMTERALNDVMNDWRMPEVE